MELTTKREKIDVLKLSKNIFLKARTQESGFFDKNMEELREELTRSMFSGINRAIQEEVSHEKKEILRKHLRLAGALFLSPLGDKVFA